jgi:aspartate racemase
MARTIGLIGGMSWESTAVYYRLINEIVRERRGGLHSADILMHSVDFDAIVGLQKAGRWDEAGARLGAIGQGLAGAGAACILICTNTMHLVADAVEAMLPVPLINIIDVTGAALQRAGIRRPLLLATRYTMEHGFYAGRLKRASGIEVMVPDEAGRMAAHDIIFNELCRGVVKDSSRDTYRALIAKARDEGADAVILGCTEICLLIGQGDTDLPVFDSTTLHAQAAVDFVDTQTAIRAVA